MIPLARQFQDFKHIYGINNDLRASERWCIEKAQEIARNVARWDFSLLFTV